MKKTLQLVAALAAVGGLVLLGYGAFQYVTVSRFLGSAGRALGKVAEIETAPVDEQENRYCPIVEFDAPGGKTVSFVDVVCTAETPHRKGDVVPVLYDPADPPHARIDAGETALGSALQPLLGALAAWAAAAAALWLSGRPRPSPAR